MKPLKAMQLMRFMLLLFIFVNLQSCTTPDIPATKADFIVFGTVVNLTVYHADVPIANQAIADVEKEFQIFHHEWHAWEQGGIVSKIDQAIQAQKPIRVSESVKQFILKSQTFTQQSDGLFDPGIGSLIALWGFHSEHWQGPPPSNAEIQAWLQQHPSLLDVYFEGQQLLSRNPNVRLDFGGNAKGLAIDIALNTLRQAGIENAVVNIGGDMKVIGSKPNNQAWSVGIQNPENPQQVIASLQLNDNESVVTSGTYQRYFEWQGKRYSHILNPNTGYPADSFSSVTVIHHDATTADSAATAILVAGPTQWQSIAKKMGITQVLCIDKQGKILQTKAMEKRAKLL